MARCSLFIFICVFLVFLKNSSLSINHKLMKVATSTMEKYGTWMLYSISPTSWYFNILLPYEINLYSGAEISVKGQF